MPRVIFYLGLRSRGSFLLNFLEKKILERGLTALILTPPGKAAQLDEWLWTARPGNFIPHIFADEFNAEDGTPVLIAEAGAGTPEVAADVLVLWGCEAPEEFSSFAHIVIAPAAGGEEWRKQKDLFADRGCEINIHKMS